MKKLVIKRIFMIVPTLFLIALLSFSFTYFSPGNTAELLLEKKDPGGVMAKERIQEYEEKLGLNKPFLEIFLEWLQKAVRGDLGESLDSSQPVFQIFKTRFEVTGRIILITTLMYIFLGVIFGFLSAFYKDRLIDRFIRYFAVFNSSTPSFWLGLFLLWFFSVKIKGLNIFGYRGFYSLLLPSFIIAFGSSGSFSRVLRGVTIEALESSYVLMAKATGMKNYKIFFTHILKNILNTITTLVGLKTMNLLGGTVIIENIFGLPGIGKTLIDAINMKDFPIISGFLLIMGVMIVIINIIMDVLYAVVDPKVRCQNE